MAGELLHVVGNYSTTPRKIFMCKVNATYRRPCRRVGGDDDFTNATRLGADVHLALRQSSRCRRFLVADAFWPPAGEGDCAPHLDGASARPRWLVHIPTSRGAPGLSHALNMYLSGVARAHACGMRLIYRPVNAGHGLSSGFDDLLWADPRGMVPPLWSPALGCDHRSNRRSVDGRDVSFNLVHAPPPVQTVELTKQLAKAPPDSVTLVSNVANLFPQPINRSIRAEVLYTGLWIRERFWSAVHALARANPSAPRRTARHASDAAPVLICVHIRRGDILQRRRSHRFVGLPLVLSALAAVREAIRRPLTGPAVRLRVFSEPGLDADELHGLRAFAPEVEVTLDTSLKGTVDALVTMASSDVLLLGGSGFSWWAGMFSCGLKLGGSRVRTPTSDSRVNDRLPLRHFSRIYFSDGAYRPDENESIALVRSHARAVPELREAWHVYWTCKLNPMCRQHTLCAAKHIDNGEWVFASSLSRALAADESLMQWRAPPETFGIQNGSASLALANLLASDGGIQRSGSASWRRNAGVCTSQLQRYTSDGARATNVSLLLDVSDCTRRATQRTQDVFLSCKDHVSRY